MKRMKKSNCIHCIQVIPLRGEHVKGRKYYDCTIDAWDSLTYCSKNYCNYYIPRPKTKTKTETKGQNND